MGTRKNNLLNKFGSFLLTFLFHLSSLDNSLFIISPKRTRRKTEQHLTFQFISFLPPSSSSSLSLGQNKDSLSSSPVDSISSLSPSPPTQETTPSPHHRPTTSSFLLTSPSDSSPSLSRFTAIRSPFTQKKRSHLSLTRSHLLPLAITSSTNQTPTSTLFLRRANFPPPPTRTISPPPVSRRLLPPSLFYSSHLFLSLVVITHTLDQQHNRTVSSPSLFRRPTTFLITLAGRPPSSTASAGPLYTKRKALGR